MPIPLNKLSELEQMNLSGDFSHLRVVIDNLPDYIYFKDTSHRFIDANKATISIMRCKSLSELIGKTDFDFYPREFAEKFLADEKEIFRTGRSKMDIVETIIDEKESLRILSTSKVVLKDKNGKPVGLVGIGRDITERKQAEDVLKRDNQMFEKIIEERTKKLLETQSELARSRYLSDIGKLAAMVGHELRNPLAVIQLATEKLKKDPNLTDNKYLVNISKKLTESNTIIDNLLTYSRLKPPAYENADLLKLLYECVNVFKEKFKDVSVTMKHDREMLNVKVDPLQVKQVFANILNNAAQARCSNIELIVTETADKIKIVFKDDGVGIEPEDLEKVFQPFFSNKPKGTGLGLTICSELIHLHGGRIDVESIKDKGTTFTVILPIKR